MGPTVPPSPSVCVAAFITTTVTQPLLYCSRNASISISQAKVIWLGSDGVTTMACPGSHLLLLLPVASLHSATHHTPMQHLWWASPTAQPGAQQKGSTAGRQWQRVKGTWQQIWWRVQQSWDQGQKGSSAQETTNTDLKGALHRGPWSMRPPAQIATAGRRPEMRTGAGLL